MARLVVGVVIAVVVFTIYAFVDCALTERSRVRGLPKALWLLVVVVLPLIGGLLWFLIGRGPTRRRFLPPDDDPTFLGGGRRNSPSSGHAPTVDELALLEQELANLDSDADDDGDGRSR
ncbi:MAG TPA: PLDc N-terminal domain-containing protein [Amnibacterium sp.]|uniref:PLDc N-terminal domain-containing protein n=1 Tax=Amnibacterium sp. TaxID=1872496 RepID=UPI002F95D502